MSRKKTIEEFRIEYYDKFGDFYDLSKSVYNGAHTRMIVGCPIHGEFKITPHELLKGQGCKHCGIERRAEKRKLKLYDFITRSTIIHNGKYIYDLVELEDYNKAVKIICPIHGVFEETPRDHLQGCGCKKCAMEYVSELFSDTKEEFVKKSKIVHGDKYDYSLFEYRGSKEEGDIICPIHGIFPQKPCHHLQGSGCPKCGNVSSHFEDEIINSLNHIEVEHRNRMVLNGKEIDIYLPQYNLGIEFNGLYWHSEENGKDKKYHLSKLNECNKQGVELIQIFEDEWVNKREICETILKNEIGVNTNEIIYDNDCIASESDDSEVVNNFLNKNCIFGIDGDFDISIVTYFNDNLIGIMTFKKYCDNEYTLNRIATSIKYKCIGVEEKMFDYFKEKYSPNKVTHFADRRWTLHIDNNIFTKLGFKIDSFIEPSFTYYKKNTRLGRIKEEEITDTSNCTRIWDCGKVKYVYSK